MRRALLILLAATATHAAPVDFTPRTALEDDDEEEALAPGQTFFRRGHRRIFFRAPKGWKITGTPEAALVISTQLPEARFTIANSAHKDAPPFEGAALDAYRLGAIRSAPPNATRVEITGEIATPLKFNGWTSREFLIAYDHAGRSWKKSILFVTLTPGEQLTIGIEAETASFGPYYEAAKKSLRGIHEELSDEDQAARDKLAEAEKQNTAQKAAAAQAATLAAQNSARDAAEAAARAIAEATTTPQPEPPPPPPAPPITIPPPATPPATPPAPM